MTKKIILILLLIAGTQLSLADEKNKRNTASAKPACEVDNPSLKAMPLIEIELVRKDGSKHAVPARLANTNATRAAGFQRVCASTIAAMPILFEFNKEHIPSFHMNNVVASIDIAFIKKSGQFESIQAMHPYSIMDLKKRLWSPKQPVKYALEVHPGFFEEHNLDLHSRLSWENSTEKNASDET